MDEAKLRHDSRPAAEAIAILEHIRESWLLLMDTLERENDVHESSHPEPLLAIEA
jgi:hypothetical protein